MLAENISNKEEKFQQKTCEYQGVTYIVMTDMETKRCFINVDGKKMFLDCNGNVANKQRGTKSIKSALDDFGYMKQVQDYFISNKQWNFYLLFTLGAHTGRRISDLRAALWSDFFYKNGKMKKYWDVKKEDEDGYRISGEKKTGKVAEIFINEAVQEAFRIFLENETSIDFEYDYEEPVFKQLHGTHRGKIISQEGYRQALIKAGNAIGCEIRSHSMRRGMGSMMLKLHPNDPKAKSILMEIYNHSSEAMTNRYIGETDKLKREFIEDYGKQYKKYVMDGEEIPFMLKTPRSVYDNSELRQYMMESFGKILDNASETDPIKLMGLYNELLDGLESIAK